MMFVIMFVIILVAAFNLVSMLVVMVTDKRADIAILRTLGRARERSSGFSWLPVVSPVPLGPCSARCLASSRR